MNREEFEKLVKRNDERKGHSEWTMKRMKHRENRINEIDERVIGLAEHLKKENIGFMVMETIFEPGKHPMFADLYIPKYKIAVRVVKGDDNSMVSQEVFHRKARGRFYPVYCRCEDSLEFLIEKVTNTMKSAIAKPKKGKFTIVGQKEKRNRIKVIGNSKHL